MLMFSYIFSTRCGVTDKYEEIENDTGLLCLALAEKKLLDWVRSEKRQEWELLSSKDCNDSFTADACSNYFPRTCSAKHKEHDKRESGLFKAES